MKPPTFGRNQIPPLGTSAGKRILFLPAPTVPARQSSRLHGAWCRKAPEPPQLVLFGAIWRGPNGRVAIESKIAELSRLIAI